MFEIRIAAPWQEQCASLLASPTRGVLEIEILANTCYNNVPQSHSRYRRLSESLDEDWGPGILVFSDAPTTVVHFWKIAYFISKLSSIVRSSSTPQCFCIIEISMKNSVSQYIPIVKITSLRRTYRYLWYHGPRIRIHCIWRCCSLQLVE